MGALLPVAGVLLDGSHAAVAALKSLASSRENRAVVTSMCAGSSTSGQRVPLRYVVSDCVRRWFQETLKEAQAGDAAMQVLVGQMYQSGYGVPKDEKKGREWIEEASKRRLSALEVCYKHPGYNASDSDSDEGG